MRTITLYFLLGLFVTSYCYNISDFNKALDVLDKRTNLINEFNFKLLNNELVEIEELYNTQQIDMDIYHNKTIETLKKITNTFEIYHAIAFEIIHKYHLKFSSFDDYITQLYGGGLIFVFIMLFCIISLDFKKINK